MAEMIIQKTGAGFLIDASAKTYETCEKQIREFISNSLDAGATKVKIEVVPSQKKLIITDNGAGMDEEEFMSNYLVIGCSEKYGDTKSIGRIGVGKFSAIPLCDYLNVRTRKENGDKVYSARLNLGLLRNPLNRNEDVKNIVLGEGDYTEPKIDDPDDGFSPRGSFTKMVLEGIPFEVENSFSDEEAFLELRNKLGKILPLKYSEVSTAIQKLKKVDTELADELGQSAERRCIQVTIHTPAHPEGKELFRTLFGDDFEKAGEQICGDVFPLKAPDDTLPAPIKIIGYFADMTEGSRHNAQWKGLNVRVQNTTVVENYFFDYPDAQAQNRITGEIQISNVNEEELITMNRAGFVTGYEEYKTISDWITENLSYFGKAFVRKRVDFNSEMKKKTAQLSNRNKACVKLEKAIREVFEEDGVEADLNLLSKNILRKEEEIDQEEALLNEYPDEIIEIIPVPIETTDKIVATPKGGRFSVMVPEQFLEYKLEINNEDYELRYVNHKDDEPIIDVDVGEKVIRVNENSSPMKNASPQASPQILLALTLVEYAFAAFTDDIEVLKEKIFEAITTAFE